MINSLQINNFRCFKTASINDCRKINLVVGQNGSGKTALLEAIFLASGLTPELALRLRNWRGFEFMVAGPVSILEDTVWQDLFYKYDKSKSIFISLTGTGEHARSLKIYQAQPNLLVPLEQQNNNSSFSATSPISFEWQSPGRSPYNVTPQVVNGQFQIPMPPHMAQETYFFAANHPYSSTETAVRFSNLTRTFKQKEIVQKFIQEFDIIKDISLEIFGGSPLMFATIDGMPEKLPLNLVSGGINKLAAIVFAIPAQNDGVLLIDEIENGFYYKRLPTIWRLLLASCIANNTQIFASTHSAECIQAAAMVAKGNPEHFSVIHVKDGKTRQFSGENFVSAIDEEIEIR